MMKVMVAVECSGEMMVVGDNGCRNDNDISDG